MKKHRSFTIIKVIFMFAVLAAAVFCLYRATAKMNRGQEAESLEAAGSFDPKGYDDLLCHGGVYPPTIQYLKDNYGIQIDESRFTVFYEAFAKNMMPDITVMENQELVE